LSCWRIQLLPGLIILLNTFSQVHDHSVDAILQFVHLSRRFDVDHLCEVALHGRITNVGESSYLRGQILSHRVDITRDVLPASVNVLIFGLTAHFAVDADIPSYTLHAHGPAIKSCHHVIDGVFESLDFSLSMDLDFLGQITSRNSLRDTGNISYLTG